MKKKILGISTRFHIACLIVTVFLAVTMCITADLPSVSLKDCCTDHYSHMGSVVMFMLKGSDIYQKPLASLCDHTRDRAQEIEEAALSLGQKTCDICFATGEDFNRPLVINWQDFPRPYPPGHLLYFLPEALLYKFVGVSFKTVNCVSIVKFVLIAHLAWIFMVALLVEINSRPLRLFLMAFSYSQLISIALAGIYDGVAVLAASSGLWAFKKNSLFLSFFLICSGLFLHFRMLWFAPVIALTGFKLLKHLRETIILEHTGGLAHGIKYTALMFSTVMLILTAWCFFTLWPWLVKFPVNNPLYFKSIGIESIRAFAYFAVVVGVLAVFFYWRAWLIFVSVCCCTVFFLRTPQAWTWHHHILLACLGLPLIKEKNEHVTRQVLLLTAWYLAVMFLVFRAPIWPAWISDFIVRLSG